MTPSAWAPSTVQRGNDRRGAHRARLAAPTVTVTVSGKLIDAVGSDVSPGGMRLLAARPTSVGDEVSLVFFLDGDIVCARGLVRWCARTPHDLFAFGVVFTALEEDGQSLVARYCGGRVS
jgi:PilZ domain